MKRRNLYQPLRLTICRLLIFLLSLFGVSAFGQNYVIRHNFGIGTDGNYPNYGVTFDRSGNMYGTTLGGGNNGTIAGVIWEITSSGSYKVLHNFGSSGDGANPKGGVTIDRSGNLFGTTVGGGTNGGGTVWEITSSGTYQKIHDFGADTDGLGPESSVTVDNSGNLFGTTFFNHPADAVGILWEISTAGNYRILHKFGSGADAAAPYAKVVIDGSGNIFGTSYGGGANNVGSIWEMSSTGQFQVLHSFNSDSDGCNPITGVTIDGAGNLFGTTGGSGGTGTGPGTVWELSNSGLFLTLHSFGSSGDGWQPEGEVTFDASGNMYGTAVNQVENSGGVLWTINNGTYQILHQFGSGSDGYTPRSAVTVDSSGNLFGTTSHGGINGFTGGIVYEIVSNTISKLALSPTSLTGGASATGTITLSGPAPAGGFSIDLSSSNVNATVPSSVIIASGATAVNFSVTTTSVTNTVTSTITAKLGGSLQSATLTLKPALLQSVSVNPTSVVGGSPSTGTITLSQGAPAGGALVTLSTSSASSSLPDSVTVPAGATTVSFPITTSKVAADTSATISATTDGTVQTTTLAIVSAQAITVSLNPTSILGGNSSTGTIKLNTVAGTGGLTITLASDHSEATVPASVTIASGASTASFTINTVGVNSQTSVVIRASLGGTPKTATLTITPTSLSAITLNPTKVSGGSSSTGTVTLTGPAGSGGAVLSLSSDNAAATVPASVTVPAGQTTANFNVTTVTVATVTNPTIAAHLNGTTQQAILAINPVNLVSVTLNPSTVAGGTTTTGTITLDALAGAGGLSVTLTSNNSVAKVSGSVMVPAGQSSVKFAVSTIAVTDTASATITAGLSGKAQTAFLTVVPVALYSVSFSPSMVLGGTSTTGTVSLNGLAGKGGALVKLSSNLSSVKIPPTVMIAAGTAISTFQAKTSAVSAQLDAIVTAKLGSVTQTASLTINPPTLTQLSVLPATVAGGASSVGQVTLSSPAASGGFSISLSSSSTAATCPKSVVVPAGKTSATFAIKTIGVANQTVSTIKGTANGLTRSADLTINAPTLTSLILTPPTVVGGKTISAKVTISSAAHSAGFVVTVASSLSAATVPVSVKILAGQTSATFSIKTVKVSQQSIGTITASSGNTSKTATITIK